MDISFIMPVFNRLELTQACVDSLRESLPNRLTYEVILVDDGSEDGTREWMASLASPSFVVLYNDKRGGYAYANNRASRVARGRLLGLLNNDLVFEPGWLEPMIRVIERRRQAGIVGNIQIRADTGAIDHAGIVVNLCGKPEHLDGSQGPLWLLSRSSCRQAVTGACCLLRRDRFIEVGGFDEGFMNGCEDVDLCYRLRDRRLKVYVANRSIVRHHVSASPGRKDFDERNTRRLFAKWRDRLVLDGAHYWPRAYLRRHWLEPRNSDHRLLGEALPRFLGLTRRPAPSALRLLDANVSIEEARWDEILGSGEVLP